MPTCVAGGSGLLAVYIAGLVMANRPVRAYPSIVGFHEGLAFAAQVALFVVLGLLGSLVAVRRITSVDPIVALSAES